MSEKCWNRATIAVSAYSWSLEMPVHFLYSEKVDLGVFWPLASVHYGEYGDKCHWIWGLNRSVRVFIPYISSQYKDAVVSAFLWLIFSGYHPCTYCKIVDFANIFCFYHIFCCCSFLFTLIIFCCFYCCNIYRYASLSASDKS